MPKSKAAYLEYLKSPHWITLRRRVFARDEFRCTKCRSPNCIEAHHKFYRERWEDADLSDLVTLCRGCHEQEHELLKRIKNAQSLESKFRRSSGFNRAMRKKAKARKQWKSKWQRNVSTGRWSF